jgi:hypothetical protein
LVIDVLESLKPLIDGLDVNRSKPAMAPAPQLRYEVTADETSSSRYDRQVIVV